VVCFVAVLARGRLDYDDSLDVVGVHMVGGVLGVVLTGAFASLAINSAGVAASVDQFGRQVVLAVVTVAYSFAATMILLKITDVVVGLRVSPQAESQGLDLSQHGEVGYRWSDLPDEVAEPSPVTQPPQ
jgi:ammonium transporter, Amt family